LINYGHTLSLPTAKSVGKTDFDNLEEINV